MVDIWALKPHAEKRAGSSPAESTKSIQMFKFDFVYQIDYNNIIREVDKYG